MVGAVGTDCRHVVCGVKPEVAPLSHWLLYFMAGQVPATPHTARA